jgi:hypothetical protein
LKSIERPIFIVGVHRSGTTMLRYMLNSHPRIYIPPESDFIPRFFKHQPTKNLGTAEIRRILKIIFTRYRFVREWSAEVPAFDKFIEQLPARTPAAVLEKLYRDYATQNGAVRWGDKTPIYSSYLPLIHEILPTVQFIHLIRDGRDVALSMLDTWGTRDFHIDIYFTARNWVRRTCQAQTAGALLGSNHYFELRYEKLVSNPVSELHQLCNFLGETFLPEMAEPQRLARREIESGSFHNAVRNPPTTTRVARWQTEMSPADLRLFQHVAGHLLQTLNYPLREYDPMSARERTRYTALKTKYVTLQAGRRILQALGIYPPI